MRSRLKIAAVAWLFGAAGTAMAQEPTQQPTAAETTAATPTINTDRPAITDSSVVAPAGYLVVENGITETGNAGEASFDFPETLIRYGLTSKTELRATPPDYFQNSNAGAGFASGWGDLELGLKQELLASANGLDASVIFSLSIPTGAKALSSHGIDPSILLPWSHPLSKNWTAAGMFSVAWPTQGASRNVTGQASFLLDRQNTSKWDTFIEYGGFYPSRGGPQHILHVGTSYKLTPNQQVDFHAGFGLSSAAVAHFVGIGYSLQFGVRPKE
jgi:outer membrane putative beta-barrel porin/alpha-amylase